MSELPAGGRVLVAGALSHGRRYVGLRGVVLSRDEGLIDVRLDDGLRATFFEQDLQPEAAHEHPQPARLGSDRPHPDQDGLPD